MTKQATVKATRTVTVLHVYKFRATARICFVVLSSNGTDRYNTCFNRDADHGVCGCPATSKNGCYHLNQLRPRAAAYFASLTADTAAEETARAYRDMAFDSRFN